MERITLHDKSTFKIVRAGNPLCRWKNIRHKRGDLESGPPEPERLQYSDILDHGVQGYSVQGERKRGKRRKSSVVYTAIASRLRPMKVQSESKTRRYANANMLTLALGRAGSSLPLDTSEEGQVAPRGWIVHYAWERLPF